MSRLTHHERSQNWRALIASLICLAALIALAGTARAHAEPVDQATPTTAQTVPNNGYRFYENYACIRDQTWGDFYPAVIHTISNQLDGPRDFGTNYFPVTAPDICANQVPDRQIIRVGLIPSQNSSLYSWCVAGNTPRLGTTIGGFETYAEHVEIYYNYYKPFCRDGNYARFALSEMFAQYMGLKPGYYGSLYSIVNRSRNDVLWHTGNDLLEYNNIY